MASDPGGGRVSGACHELLRRAFNSLDIRTGGGPVGSPKDLVIEGAGYANRALGALRILPDDAFRRLTAACGLAPDVPPARPLKRTAVCAASACRRTTSLLQANAAV